MVENSGYAQGSTYHIKYLTSEARNFGDEIDTLFKQIDASMSTYIPSSLISQVNKGDTTVQVDAYFLTVLKRSMEIAKETQGAFDPTVGPLVKLWGFGYDKIRTDVTETMIAKTMGKTGFENITIQEDEVTIPAGFNIDFNAIAQGYTVDVISEYLEEHGIRSYMVEVGGEVRTRGTNQDGNIWKIGVDKPTEQINAQDRFQFILELNNAALATSGNYRKFWVDKETGIKYAHTIDPKTGQPARNKLLSASIVADNAMDADGYATVCMVKGLEACKEFLAAKPGLEGYLVYADEDGSWGEYITQGFREFIVN